MSRIKRRPKRGGIPRPADWRSFDEGRPPEKQWVSMAIVIDDPEVPAVEFNKDDGQVYVNVSLEPSKVPARCRVSSFAAGDGEAEYFPFLPGDELIVVLPLGREDSGAVIIGRLNNQLDAFPMDSVAGQDPTTNTFALRRRRTPTIEEFAGPVLFRNALSGALFSLDNKGGVTIKDGENSAVQISADALTLQGPSTPTTSPKLLFQMNFTEERAMLQVNDAQLLISGSGAPSQAGQAYLTLPADLFVAFGNNQPAEHVATTESTLALLVGLLTQVASTSGGPVTTASIGAAIVTFLAAVAAGGLPLDPATATALASGLVVAASTPKPPANPLSGVQLLPKLGAVFFHTG